jgi:hypothetical protein
MSQYDLTRLSSKDFEELVCDLLQAEWSISLEVFKAGRDQGIDLRSVVSTDGVTVVQCKHYEVSGFQKLLAHLRHIERAKVARLKPDRYVLATSVGLTPANKDDISSSLHPFILNSGDILGRDEIESLLRKHPTVERSHFKLWFTSTNVLERVLHNAEHCQTQFEVNRVIKRLPLFVQSDALPRALEILEQNRIVIVSGVPGIGKTTLAEMLLFMHLEQNYEPVVIRSELIEGKALYKAATKQIFYFDDFLGQTFLAQQGDFSSRNHDQALLDFVQMVQESGSSRLILTTREHVLKTAIGVSERLRQSSLLDHQCHLTLADYSFLQRTRILYNHLYFSDLPNDYKKAVIDDELYIKIAEHENFNPRVIEWLSGYARVRQVDPEKYQTHVRELLNEPHRVWRHAFERQISEASRNVLICLWSLEGTSSIIALEQAWASLHTFKSKKYNYSVAPNDFRVALDELENTFIIIQNEDAALANGSVSDVVEAVIETSRDYVRDILASAIRFLQVHHLWLCGEYSREPIGKYLRDDFLAFLEASSRLICNPVARFEVQSDGTSIGFYVDSDVEDRVDLVVDLYIEFRTPRLSELLSKGIQGLIERWASGGINLGSGIALMRRLTGRSLSEDRISQEGFRALLNVVLGKIETAPGEALLQILEFRDRCEGWSSADNERLSAGLDSFRRKELLAEQHAKSLDQLFELRGTLQEMTEEFKIEFDDELKRIDEEIERRDETGIHYRNWLKSFQTIPVDALVVSRRGIEAGIVIPDDVRLRQASDKEVARAMFRTLLEHA